MGDGDAGPLSRPDRQYPSRPIVAVGAVVKKAGSILLVQRGTSPGYGHWTIPGGAVELGETVRQAAEREVAEECGIEVEIADVVEVIDRILVDGEGRVEYHYVLIDFAARYSGGQLEAGSDILAARWVSLSDLPAVGLPEITLSVIREAVKLLDPQ